MNRRIIFRLLCAFLVGLTVAGVALAQVSPNFDVHWSLLSSGGSSRQSASYRIGDTLGQVAAGQVSSPNYQVNSGLWQAGFGSAWKYRVYLPIVKR